tara:strand:+ start:6815 stop:7300 length:486 start_codon:yes stop_codon:yes gene_type:complete
MGYENNAFPLASGTSYNQYGTRGVQDSIILSGGHVHGSGTEHSLVIYLNGDEFAGGAVAVASSGTLPAGSVVIGATMEITSAITMGNADNDIVIGTSTSEATNGVDFDNTTGAVGTYAHAAINGTWAAPLAADTVVGIDVSGTTPSMDAGLAKVVIRYTKI